MRDWLLHFQETMPCANIVHTTWIATSPSCSVTSSRPGGTGWGLTPTPDLGSLSLFSRIQRVPEQAPQIPENMLISLEHGGPAKRCSVGRVPQDSRGAQTHFPPVLWGPLSWGENRLGESQGLVQVPEIRRGELEPQTGSSH